MPKQSQQSVWSFLVSVLLFVVPISDIEAAGKWSGYVALEWRNFPNSPVDSRQHDDNISLVAQPEYYRAWKKGRESFTFVPFIRIDQYDDERSHTDIRELTWVRAKKTHEWRIGIRKVFWGVTESQHLVDIINQTDLLENIDGEDKLGQPMINLALIRQWGTLDIFLLNGFRERTFPGVSGRLRTQPRVDTDQAVFESARGRGNTDFAIRWTNSIGDWDIGLSHFSGTSREPRFVVGSSASGEPVLVPHYDLINQTGLDLQYTKGSWLWKLETIRRQGQGPTYYAAVGGFEYTFYGIFKTGKDLGLLFEYHYDDRGLAATTPFQNDIFVGLRLTFNDTQSTEILAGTIVDQDTPAKNFFLEASRRLGSHWKGSLEIRTFRNAPAGDFLFAFRNDDYLQLEFAYYF